VSFQFILPKGQGILVRLPVGRQPAQISGLLRSHPAALIEIDRLLRHQRMSLA
jgi:hypothetical protein